MLSRDYLVSLGLIAALLAAGCSEKAELPEARTVISHAAPGSVNIYRDKYGVPHLYAEREEDGFWGHGYTAAEDHLEGILIFYLSLKGELAKAFGPGTVDLTTTSVRSLPPGLSLPLGEIEDTVASDLAAKQWRHLEEHHLPCHSRAVRLSSGDLTRPGPSQQRSGTIKNSCTIFCNQ